MNGNSTVSVVVEGSGKGVVAHVGLHALGAFADRLGLGDSLSARIPITGERLPLHDRGKILVQTMLMLTGGGEACADIERLRSQAALFGSVPSDSTLYRTFRSISPDTLTKLWQATAEARAKVWRRATATTGKTTVVLDIDASLHQVHSENKQEAAANYKGGYGFHPIYCFADATGEALAVRLRPGNAGANNIADHVALLDDAIAGLPAEIALGHHAGDDPALVRRPIQVRTDSAGCTGFVWQARNRNVGFAVIARSNASIHGAISRIAFDADRWQPALGQDGEERPGAAVAEVTELVDLSGWPAGTRLIVRREPLHPGAQQSLFPSSMFRYWGHYTDAAGEAVDLDVHMRAHAHVEDNIRRLKDSGAQRFPFTDIDANRAWLAVVCFADGLVRWFQRLCLSGTMASAEPKTLPWGLWHTPARIVHRARRRIVRVLDGWPGTDALLDAYGRIAGRVGMTGHSYVGSTPSLAAAAQPKGLGTIVPSAGMATMYDHQFQAGVPYFLQWAGPMEAYEQIALERHLPGGDNELKNLEDAGCGLPNSSLVAGEDQLSGRYAPWHSEREWRAGATAAQIPIFMVQSI